MDIDPQAVETTKLSLLLKVLEGETNESLERQWRYFHQRALPDLGRNIKCGNSLIGPDFYNGQQMSLLDDDERYRINVFDWHAEFPEIMKAGGFDAVIGNPPYGFHQIHSDKVKPYLKSRYVSSSGSFEHYFLFYEASLRLLRRCGRHGFIVPVTWLTIPSAASLRRFVLGNHHIAHTRLGPIQYFTLLLINSFRRRECYFNTGIGRNIGFGKTGGLRHRIRIIDLDICRRKRKPLLGNSPPGCDD